jgi:siroheme synthase
MSVLTKKALEEAAEAGVVLDDEQVHDRLLGVRDEDVFG